MPRRQFRAVLFDAGNTLMHLDYEFIAGVLAEHGYPRAPLDLRIAEYSAKVAIDQHVMPRAEPQHVEALLWPAAPSERPSYFGTIAHALGIPDAAIQPILDTLQAHNRGALSMARRCSGHR